MLKAILKTATFRQSQITVLGTLINGVLGALFYVFLARFLGPSNFGLFIIAVTSIELVAGIADIGTNTGLVRFVSKNLSSDLNKSYQFLKLCLKIKAVNWIVSFLGLFFLAPFLAVEVFHKEQLIIPMRLAGLGVGGALLFTFATSTLQAYQKYFTWTVINILTNLLRFIMILILSYYLVLDVSNSLLIFIFFPFFGFFISLFLLPARKIIQAKFELSLIKDLFKYTIPVAAFTIIASISSRLDTYLTAALLSSKDVGIYGIANQLVQFMPQLVSALGLVSSPKFASFQNNQQMLTYFRKFQLLVSGLVGLGILVLPVLIYIIPLILGQQYQPAIWPFIILFFAQLVFLFSIPVHHSVIFYFGRPEVFIWISVGHLIIIGGLGYILIASYGILGAAITVLAGTSFNFLYPLVWLLVKLKK